MWVNLRGGGGGLDSRHFCVVCISALALFSLRLPLVWLLCPSVPWPRSRLSQGTKFREILVSSLGSADLVSMEEEYVKWGGVGVSLLLALCLHSFLFKIENSIRHPIVFLPSPVECEAGVEKQQEHQAQTTYLCYRHFQLGGLHGDALNHYI